MRQTDLDVQFDLMKVGLTEREAKVYQVLVGVESMTAGAIPRFTDVPRTKVYEVLNTLIRKGFCKEKSNGPEGNVYYAVHPQIALGNLLLAEEKRLSEVKTLNEQISQVLTPIYTNSSERLKDYDFVETLRGPKEIVTRYRQLRDTVEVELLEFTKGPLAMSEEDINAGAELTKELITKGIRAMSIYEIDDEMQQNHSFDFALKKDKEIGVEARYISSLPVKLSLFDDKYTMIFMDDPTLLKQNLTALVIEHRGMNTLIKMAFEAYWEMSIPIEED